MQKDMRMIMIYLLDYVPTLSNRIVPIIHCELETWLMMSDDTHVEIVCDEEEDKESVLEHHTKQAPLMGGLVWVKSTNTMMVKWR